MKAIVDQDTCIGCSLCCELCDSVFRMNDNNKSEAYKEANANNQDYVQSAIDNCPVSAISWDE